MKGMSLLKKLAGETAIYGIGSILSRLLHWVILTPYFTRIFLQGEYGVVQEFYTYAALLMVLFTYRMETAFFRFGSKEEGFERPFSTASLSLLFSTTLLVTLFLLFSRPLAAWLQYPDHREYVIWFTFIIAFDALAAIPFARLRLENRPIRFAALKTLNILINILFIFFFLEVVPWLIERGWSGLEAIYDEANRINYVFISNMIASLCILLLLLPAYAHIRLVFDRALWREMLYYAFPLVIAGLAAVVNQLIGNPMLKFLASDDIEENLKQVGIFGAAAKLAVIMNLFTTAFNYAAEPFFFRHAARDDAQTIYAQVGQAFALVGSLVFLGIVLYIDLIQYFLGRDFREGLGIVPILLLANLCLGLYYNFSIWFKLTDRTRFGGYIAVAGAAITIGLNFLLIPRLGYFGPAWAALACYGFMALASYATGQRYYPIYYPIGRMLTYIALAIGGYFLSQLGRSWLDGQLAPTLLLNTGILLLYLLLLLWIERRHLKQLLHRR